MILRPRLPRYNSTRQTLLRVLRGNPSNANAHHDPGGHGPDRRPGVWLGRPPLRTIGGAASPSPRLWSPLPWPPSIPSTGEVRDEPSGPRSPPSGPAISFWSSAPGSEFHPSSAAHDQAARRLGSAPDSGSPRRDRPLGHRDRETHGNLGPGNRTGLIASEGCAQPDVIRQYGSGTFGHASRPCWWPASGALPRVTSTPTAMSGGRRRLEGGRCVLKVLEAGLSAGLSKTVAPIPSVRDLRRRPATATGPGETSRGRSDAVAGRFSQAAARRNRPSLDHGGVSSKTPMGRGADSPPTSHRFRLTPSRPLPAPPGAAGSRLEGVRLSRTLPPVPGST